MSSDRELETELRQVAERFDQAFPALPQLSRSIMLRAEREPGDRSGGRLRLVTELALAGLLVLGAIGLGIAFSRGRIMPVTPTLPASSARVTATASSPSPRPSLPAAVVNEAGLMNVANLITPEHLQAQLGSTRLTVIGIYADPVRTIVFFRVDPEANYSPWRVGVGVYDAQGFINDHNSGSGGVAGGDHFVARNAGPQVASDGLAHLRIVTSAASLAQISAGQPGETASFSVTLRVPPAMSLPAPGPFRAGSWTVTVEKLEATPAVVDLQALVAGATPEAFQAARVTLVDTAGHPLREVVGGTGLAGRIYYQWVRPTAAGIYHLRIEAPGGTRTITIDLPALSG